MGGYPNSWMVYFMENPTKMDVFFSKEFGTVAKRICLLSKTFKQWIPKIGPFSRFTQ